MCSDGRRDRQDAARAAARRGRRAAGRAADELVDRGVERQRARLDLFAQRVPRGESVLARDHRLRVVQREASARELGRRHLRKRGQRREALRARPRSCACAACSSDLACFFSCSRFGRSGSVARVIQPPCLSLWFANRQHGGVRAVDRRGMTVGLALRANPRAPFAERRAVAGREMTSDPISGSDRASCPPIPTASPLRDEDPVVRRAVTRRR